MKTVKFFTLGCKVNQYDTQSIRERFLRSGFREISNGNPSDVCVINTCTVTAHADAKSKYMITRSIRENPRAKIIVTGCLVDKDALSISSIKGVDYIVSKRFFPQGISSFDGHTRAFLKVQDGCNNFCSYCKVPLVRGRSRSRSLDEVIEEARRLVRNGFKEIVLTGICLGSYGKDLKPKKSLVDAIQDIEKIDGLLRIRLSSIEARDVSKKLLATLAGSHKLCRHLHIPIQSGDNRILKLMRRKYSQEYYLKLIKRIKKAIPSIAITTDVLVGFPGETQQQFNNTIRLIKAIEPLRVHIFPYSRRKDTIADSLKDTLDADTMRQRIATTHAVAQACERAFKGRFFNKNMEVLVEKRSKDHSGYWEGYTDNYIRVLILSPQVLTHQIIKVELKEFQCDINQEKEIGYIKDCGIINNVSDTVGNFR